jgi:hypothetical protein
MPIRKLESGQEFQTVSIGQTVVGATTVLVEQTEAQVFCEGLHGYTTGDPSGDIVVVLSGRLEGKRRRMVLIHEMLHAISETYGLDLSERTVRCLEQGVEQGFSGLGLLVDQESSIARL